MAVPTLMSDLSTTAASNSPAGSESPISTDDFHRAIQSILRHTQAKGSDIASATTTNIGAATGRWIDVTGTTTITGLGTIAAGIERLVRFTGALTLTHNATSLILPGSANITTANGDCALFESLGSGNWKCAFYMKQDGTSLVGFSGGTVANATTFSSTVAFNGATTVSADMTFSGSMLKLVKGADVASATALPLITDGNYFDVTGTTTITSFNSVGVGTWVRLHFDGALTLTHQATDLVLPTGANITTAAGDEAEFIEYASGDWRCVSYTKASGLALTGGITYLASTAVTSGTSVDISGIPTNAKKVTVLFNSISTNGTSVLLLQLGDSGGIENTGYVSTGASSSSGGTVILASTAGIVLSGNNAAANTHTGRAVIELFESLLYITTTSGKQSTAQTAYSSGDKTLSATLSQIRLTTVNGTDTFDGSGSMIAYYET